MTPPPSLDGLLGKNLGGPNVYVTVMTVVTHCFPGYAPKHWTNTP